MVVVVEEEVEVEVAEVVVMGEVVMEEEVVVVEEVVMEEEEEVVMEEEEEGPACLGEGLIRGDDRGEGGGMFGDEGLGLSLLREMEARKGAVARLRGCSKTKGL